MQDAAECEGLAAAILEEAGLPYPIDPWLLLAYFRVRVEHAPRLARPHSRWDGERWTIYVDRRESPERQASDAIHELGHILLVANGLTNDEEHAWLLTGALLLPREEMVRALRRGVTVDRIAEDNPHVSHEMAARRAVALAGSSVLWVHDVAPDWRKPYKVVSPGWRWATRKPTAVERETMEAALESRRPIELVGGVRAWVAVRGEWVRVLCLSDCEILLAEVA